MKKISVAIFAMAIMASPLTAQQEVRAEKYMGIGYDYTINDVKAMFPGATFEDQNVAWAKPGEKLIAITGEGLTGSILIFFRDERPNYRAYYMSYWTVIVKGWNKDAKPGYEDVPTLLALGEKAAEDFAAKQSDDKGYQAKWVRWAPDSPIALSRLKAKFGEKVRYRIENSDFSTYAAWDNKGIEARLTDDKKYVEFVNFNFTLEEVHRGIERSARRTTDAISGAAAASGLPSILD